jgi:DNA-binding transcriptional ArsR family regulator
MKEGPDISLIGSLIGDPARANILTALMGGKALTATELATEAGVTLQTTSSHLNKLLGAGFIVQNKQGRHRYFALQDADVAEVLEAMMGLAEKRGLRRVRPGPKDPALRKARMCYDHLAGELAVSVFDQLIAHGVLAQADGGIEITRTGRDFVSEFGIDIDRLIAARRPLCKSCLDWSARRPHLAGALGQALFTRFTELNWVHRVNNSRRVQISAEGEKHLRNITGL